MWNLSWSAGPKYARNLIVAFFAVKNILEVQHSTLFDNVERFPSLFFNDNTITNRYLDCQAEVYALPDLIRAQLKPQALFP